MIETMQRALLQCCRAPQLEWFADSAFNAGRAAVTGGDAMSAAVLFSAAGKFHAAAAAPTPRGLANQRVCCASACKACMHMCADRSPGSSKCVHAGSCAH